jgi:hypothetical protein
MEETLAPQIDAASFSESFFRLGSDSVPSPDFGTMGNLAAPWWRKVSARIGENLMPRLWLNH